MEFPGLTEREISEGASAQSFQRGQEYYEDGAVLSIAQRGNVVEAEVEGSQPEPYSVRVEIDESGIVDAQCDCPYSWGGWCKHIVAVLLFCLEQPGEIEERTPLEQLLSELDREQLQNLLVDLTRDEPRLASVIESRVDLIVTTSKPSTSTPAEDPERASTSVDPKPFARRVRAAIRSVDYDRGWSSYSGQAADASVEVGRVLHEVRVLVAKGSAHDALGVLEAITREYLAGWDSLDDSDGDASDVFYDLGRTLAETLLSVDLTTEEKRAWTDRLQRWQVDLEDYGLDEALDPALEAAEQGWDFPPLLRILRDGVTELEEPDVEGATWDDDLITIRLSVLERQGRHEEYLNLARAAGSHLEYATMLVRVGRTEEASEYGLREFTTADDVEELAKALRDRGEPERAVEIARHGLSLEGPKAGLAYWLRDFAVEKGMPDLAISSALIALYEDPFLVSYLRAQEIAGEGWQAARDEVLAQLRQSRSFRRDGLVDIFLHEGLIDDAIAVADRTSDYRLVERVVDAAMDSRPEWAIKACFAQAEPIMDEGRAQYYDVAAGWVGKARRAFQTAGRDDEWRVHVNALIAKHNRKYKLVPLLKKLAA